MVTVNGRVRLWRVRWHCCHEGSQTPIDAWLDETEQAISEGAREMACRVSQHASGFQHASDTLRRTARIEISKESLRQLVEAEGRKVQRAMQRGQLAPEWSAAECRTEQHTSRLYLGCDGVKIPLVTDAEKKKRRQAIRQKRRRRGRTCKPLPRAKPGADNAYKEFRIGYIYQETMQRRLVGVTSGNHEAAGRMLNRLANQVGFAQADERIALIDGAPWIRNQIEFHGLTETIGLDFWHLQDNAQKARRVVFGEDSPQGKQWLTDLMHTFKHEGCAAAWENLLEWRKPLRGGRREAADRLLRYVAERQDIIRYPEFRKRQWHIGSGPTESACKTITQRVKGRGRRWDAANAEAMMALAALHHSGLWNQHWENLNAQTN